MPAETFWLSTSDGLRLEAVLDRTDDPLATVVVLHPHPHYGGDRHNHVVQAVRQELATTGCAVITFDFRGVGRSEGTHGAQGEERLDAQAALEAAEFHYPDVPRVLCGYSFGALVAAGAGAPDLAGVVLIAPPLSETTAAPPFDTGPVLVVAPEFDQFCPPNRAEPIVRSWTNAEFVVLGESDHFMASGAGAAAALAAAFVRRVAER